MFNELKIKGRVAAKLVLVLVLAFLFVQAGFSGAFAAAGVNVEGIMYGGLGVPPMPPLNFDTIVYNETGVGNTKLLVGSLVQFIKANGIIHAPDLVTGSPTGGDTILYTGVVGDGGTGTDGTFDINASVAGVNGQVVYFRAWNAPTAAAATHYGNSVTHSTFTAADPPPPAAEIWEVPSFATNIPKIPIPDIVSCTSPVYQGATNVNLTVVSVNTAFINGTTTAEVVPNTGVTINSVTTSGLNATVNVSIAGGAAIGPRDIVLKTSIEYATGEGLFIIAVVPAGPAITSLSPSSGNVGDSFTINGSGFGADPGAGNRSTAANHVDFGATQLTNAQVTSWSDTAIGVIVPSVVTAGIYNVSVTAGSATSGTSPFTVNPEITSVSAGPYYIGNTSITINGTAFGGAIGSSTVTVGGQTLTGIVWNAAGTSITGTLPNNITAGSQNIIVTVNPGSYASNSSAITCNPYISSLSPTSGIVGATITINGFGFGASEGTSAITFAGLPATVVPATWTNTSVQVTVPTGGTIGNVVLSVNPGSYASNAVSFGSGGGGNIIFEKAGGIMMAYPNPFNPNTEELKMLFGASTGEAINIYILDTNARVIWQQTNTDLLADRTVKWDGKTSYGETVDNGFYIVRVVKDAKLVAKGKILVIKK